MNIELTNLEVDEIDLDLTMNRVKYSPKTVFRKVIKDISPLIIKDLHGIVRDKVIDFKESLPFNSQLHIETQQNMLRESISRRINGNISPILYVIHPIVLEAQVSVTVDSSSESIIRHQEHKSRTCIKIELTITDKAGQEHILVSRYYVDLKHKLTGDN